MLKMLSNLGDFVTIEDGTGRSHITFADDAKSSERAVPEIPPMLVLDAYGTPVPLVDLKFTSYVGEYAGKYVKKTNIIMLVKHQNAPLMLRFV
jgi:hypothetical protein